MLIEWHCQKSHRKKNFWKALIRPYFPFFFFSFSFHSQKLSPLIHNNLGTKPLFLDTKCYWCYFQHWNCCNGSHAVPTILFLTLATKSCFTQNFKTLQEVPIQKKPKFALYHQELKGFFCSLSVVFCFKDHYCNKSGDFCTIQISHHSWILPLSQLHSQQYTVKNTDINVCIYAWRYMTSSVPPHRKELEQGLPLLPPFPCAFVPVKDSRHDSPRVCSPLSPQKVQFWQR